MEILQIEQKYTELQNLLNEPFSNRRKLLKISEFINEVVSLANSNLTEVYITDLFSRFLTLIKSIKIRGLNPGTLLTILKQLNDLSKYDFTKYYDSEIEEAILVLQNKFNLLSNWLSGAKPKIENDIIYFPVLERCDSVNQIGFLEIIKVEIVTGENKFIIEPSESEDDPQLNEQLNLCWQSALNYCKKHIKKIKPSHTVELKFANRLGVYVGSSLGIALTLAFIEAILKHYNSPTIIKINGTIAVSGGIDKFYNIISTSKAIIEMKIETVFYSDAHIFCVPRSDELWAEEKLNLLKMQFPNRNLIIIGLKDLEDILSRRNVVDIHKQNYFERFIRYTIKKWKSIFIVIILTVISVFIFAADFDNNPAMFEQNGNFLRVQNKNGKTLWSTLMNFDPLDLNQNRTHTSRKLIDINNDGINEVIIAEELMTFEKKNFGRVACFDNNENLIWEYNFIDTVSTFRKWSKNYQISIIDTATIENKTVLLLMARNIPNFANAIFLLDVSTGKRYDSTKTLWNAGGLNNAMCGDFNKDGTKELVLSGMHNGFEKAILFSVDLNKIKGQTPAPERYKFNNIPQAELNTFILLPHTDYGKLYSRSNIAALNYMYFSPHSEEIVVVTLEGDKKPIYFYYGFDKDLNFLWVDTGDDAQKFRDSLVAKGILNLPYTNTHQYFKILKDELKYWDGKEFNGMDPRN